MYDSIREDARGFLVGLLAACTAMLVFAMTGHGTGNSGSGSTMADIYRNLSEQQRLIFLESYFKNKVNSGYYMLVSQEAAFYQVLSDNGMKEESIKALVQATSLRPKVLVKAWENAGDSLKEIDSGIMKYCRENKESPDDIAVVIDKVYLDVLAGNNDIAEDATPYGD